MILSEMNQNELNLWLVLNQIKGIGTKYALKIIENTSSLNDFFSHLNDYKPRLSLPKSLWDELDKGISEKHLKYCDQVDQWLNKTKERHLITINSPYYPERLRQIHNPPLMIYVQGNIKSISMPQIAIVGTRKASCYGLQQAFKLASDLTNYHYGITSGLAIGIDTQAHLGALDANGTTIAVLGTGLDHIYPNQNQKIAYNIIQNGGSILSEFPLNTKPDRFNFPKRNRIISGLSLGTVIIESSLKSGSLITANYALEQNREVFALPGRIDQSYASGCHQLIRQGATLVTSVDDILAEIDPMYHTANLSQEKLNITQKIDDTSELSAGEKEVLSHIDYQITSINIIIEKAKLAPGEIYEHLLTLELMQKIEVIPGGYRKL